ncbi:hypothetical protein BV25DRAFT_1868503 [Artomyces pyxidatus]|uniref:Uncharacterized protein n=1 Tax=Artomyces pyxidatus TaxID=48021 RepID=A0ACB8TBJ7_9AGAM|nr:hypothetical protein BV25DRAFT_1868503 [Artomyces pyxidatus]
MFRGAALFAFTLLSVASAQQAGTSTAEVHPTLTTQTCTKSGGCTTNNQAIVLDGNWRWLHVVGGYTNCYTGNTWNTTVCTSPTACATNCALDGAAYSSTYGITTSGNALTLDFVTGSNVGSRVYLMASNTEYQMFKLLNQEFAFDVDMSNLPCGLNGAVYLTEMDADGGMAKFPTNKAGAQYGTGYCDAQCPKDLKFINGLANMVNWTGQANDANSGTGAYGTCCSEMDIWEANVNAAAFTPHPCSVQGQTQCSGTQCGAGSDRYSGVCDADGCDFNSYRMGNTGFLGAGKTVDTTKKFTVVTQFITADNTSTGALTEIRRLYVQNGVVIQNSVANIPGIPADNSITDSFCAAQKTTFGDQNYFATKGGLTQMGTAMKTGMVLALSIWDDHTADMLWLDSDYPANASTSTPGIARGPCAPTSGVPATVESTNAGASVTYSNIKWGDIGSTYTGTPGTPSGPSSSSTGPSSTVSSSSPVTSPTGGSVAEWGQCGGINYNGPTACASPFTCHVLNSYYSQCY